MANIKIPVNTGDIAEIKSLPGQAPVATVTEQEDIVLKSRRDNLIARKNMLCTKIATDIRLSPVESISDWITRVSKDIPAWRGDLEFIESEILKVDAEARTLGELRKHTCQRIKLSKRENELVGELEMIRNESSALELLINACISELNTLRGLDDLKNATIPMRMSPPEKMDGVVYWWQWSDGIEVASSSSSTLIYQGYGKCTKCDDLIGGGESHTCRPTGSIANRPPMDPPTIAKPTGSIANRPPMDPPTIAKPTAILPVSRPGGESVIKPSGKAESTSRECPLHYEFSAAGQTHYCTVAPVETSD